jgi:hypothetical protein
MCGCRGMRGIPHRDLRWPWFESIARKDEHRREEVLPARLNALRPGSATQLLKREHLVNALNALARAHLRLVQRL